MTTQTYTNRSNAARAAKAACAAAGIPAPLSGVHFHILESSEAPGQFGFSMTDTRTGEVDRTFAPEAAAKPAPASDDPGAAFEDDTPLTGEEDDARKTALYAENGFGPVRGDEPSDEPLVVADFIGTPGERLAREVERVNIAALPAPPVPVKTARKAKAPGEATGSGPKKSELLLARAKSAEGITNEEIKALTGWTKLGGFFDAVKRAGLQMVRRREQADTRWFAVERAEGVHAFARYEIGGAWTYLGLAADTVAAQTLAKGEDMAVEASDRAGEEGCLFFAPRTALGV